MTRSLERCSRCADRSTWRSRRALLRCGPESTGLRRLRGAVVGNRRRPLLRSRRPTNNRSRCRTACAPPCRNIDQSADVGTTGGRTRQTTGKPCKRQRRRTRVFFGAPWATAPAPAVQSEWADADARALLSTVHHWFRDGAVQVFGRYQDWALDKTEQWVEAWTWVRRLGTTTGGASGLDMHIDQWRR
jgi:hypothetical protein